VEPSGESLALLHDHYKESFSLIRQAEQRRDRLLLWLFFAYAVLILEIQYPASAKGALGSVTVLGNTIALRVVPLPLLLNATWVVVAVVVLKYCQLTKSVERQYGFLHLLEDKISDALGDDDVYRREGRVYLQDYPALLNWAWIYYTILFPLALLSGTLYLYKVELSLPYSAPSQIFDTFFVVSVVVSLVLYRFLPRRKRALPESYLDHLGAAISGELETKDKSSTPPSLLRLYAVLLLAKGEDVTAEDVHNAWSVWMQHRDPRNQSIKPFEKLDESVKRMDNSFVSAIRSAARKVTPP
jgi:hypothetical protein